MSDSSMSPAGGSDDLKITPQNNNRPHMERIRIKWGGSVRNTHLNAACLFKNGATCAGKPDGWLRSSQMFITFTLINMPNGCPVGANSGCSAGTSVPAGLFTPSLYSVECWQMPYGATWTYLEYEATHRSYKNTHGHISQSIPLGGSGHWQPTTSVHPDSNNH